jgi:PIN domain nuclease of toxin-antitoxin system
VTVLLDTHALVWWRAGGERLSRAAAREIARADVVLVSPISFWEIATLQEKGRIVLDRDIFNWVSDLLEEEALEIAALSPHVATDAALLGPGFNGDPADRLIYATARELRSTLVTKDRHMQDFARAGKDVRVVW